jgi:hypothetical protein
VNFLYLGVHLLLLGVAKSFSDVGIGGLEAEASDEISDLVEVELALAGSIVQLETVLDILELILSEVDLTNYIFILCSKILENSLFLRKKWKIYHFGN